MLSLARMCYTENRKYRREINMEQKHTEAYLKRIGIDKAVSADKDGLNRLIQSHLYHVPFENLDVVDFGKIPALEIEALYEKIVCQNRGGYCFELNPLFAELLRSMGFEVYQVAVRVVWNKGFLPPVSHVGLVVTLEGQKIYCDVGYGGPGPKGALPLDGNIHEIKGEWFKSRTDDNGDILIEKKHDGVFKTMLAYTDTVLRKEDVPLMNFYCARNEQVLFSRVRVVNLPTPSGKRALKDMELTILEDGQEETIIYNNKKELEEGLAKEFGMHIRFPEE